MRGAFLAQSRRLRLAAFTALYFAQGVPIGLLTIALPAWLAQQGASLSDIAGYQAIVGLPWGLKLISGPFMDRFRFPAMGRRRPWVMGAQIGLTLSLAALAIVADPLAQLPLVMVFAFVINAFAALQDVAVDGMAIDVLPESERGRANALMGFGQVAGYSSFAALAGALLVAFGLAVASLVASITVALVFVLITVVRERPGERLLPWTAGTAAAGELAVQRSFTGIFRGLAGVLVLPMSVVLMLAEVAMRMRDGIWVSVVPVTATQVLGYSTEQYSYLQGIMGVAVAAAGILAGPLIDRYGVKRLFQVGIAGSALITFIFAMTEGWWINTVYVIGAWSMASLFYQVVFVSFIAAAMAICWGAVSASQFAIYMALSNLARSVGSAAFAPIADQLDVSEQFLLMTGITLIAFALASTFNLEPHRRRLRALDESLQKATAEARG